MEKVETAFGLAVQGRLVTAFDFAPNAVARRLAERCAVTVDRLASGQEARIAVFLDTQLAGAWGSGNHLYRQEPFRAWTQQQAYQLSSTPRKCSASASRLDDATGRAHDGTAFADLAPASRTRCSGRRNRAKSISVRCLPAHFSCATGLTMEGFFRDPLFGRYRDLIAWKLVGFRWMDGATRRTSSVMASHERTQLCRS
jgi:gluconate 2-dehydrogenase gamma chain